MNCVSNNGSITNPKMRTLLDVEHNGEALNYMDSDTMGKHYKLKPNAYNGCCTSGPTTWYKRVGITLRWWRVEGNADCNKRPSSITWSNHNCTTINMHKKDCGMLMVWHGTLEEVNACTHSTVLHSSSCGDINIMPGDVATFHVYKQSGNASSHGVMWTGKDWRSDCIQTNAGLSCYHKGRSRDGDYSVCLWRHPDLQEPGVQVIEVPIQ